MNRKTFLNFLILIAVTLMLLPSSALCELKNLDDDGLSEVYAEGFTNFTITDLPGGGNLSETEAFFNIRATTYTTIDSLKLGYHNEYDYKDPDPLSATWDEDWVNVYIGDKSDGSYYNPDSDFLAGSNAFDTDGNGTIDPDEYDDNGFYFKAVFYNINNDPLLGPRELKSISFGATYVKGDISALFNSFSGTIDDSNNGTPEYNGHILNLGQATITADYPTSPTPGQGGFDISLSIDNYDKGYWVTFDNAIVTKP